jgi:low affinity Fe/Cu permease
MRAALPTTSFGSSGARPTSRFGMLASKTAQLSRKPATFLLATLIVILWAVMGPAFHYSDTWQLVINTGTTIITFLMVFLIQNTQNRDTAALQLKLDELILATKAARNSVACIEDATDDELDAAKDDVRERIEQKSPGQREPRARTHKSAS